MNSELLLRQDKIRKALRENNLEACLLSTDVHIYYTTGRIFGGFVYLPAEGPAVSLVKRPVGLEGDHLHYIHKIEQLPDILKEEGLPIPSSLAVEGEEMGYDLWHRVARTLPDARMTNGSHMLRLVRAVKTDWEVGMIRKSAVAHVNVYRDLPGLYKPGMTDRDLAIEFQYRALKGGNLGLLRSFGTMDAFMGIILAGENAGAPSPYDYALGGAGTPTNPIGVTGLMLKPGMSVMVDISGDFSGYLDDMTRTFSIGRLTEEAYRAHQVSIDINNRLQEAMVPGAVCEDLYQTALDMADAAGLSKCFMGERQQAKFVAHGVGLVINEFPILAHRQTMRLEPNMVIAVEPKFIIDGVGAVGVENTYVVQQEGPSEKLNILDESIREL